MSNESEAAAQEEILEEPTNAREMFLGKVNVTDGKQVSYCQWTVVGSGEEWTYSAIMPLGSGTNHQILMGHGPDGAFVRKAHATSKQQALAAVKQRIAAFLKRQPRWRVID